MTTPHEMKAGALMQQVRHELAMRSAQRSGDAQQSREQAPHWSPDNAQIADKHQYTLQELLQYEDMDFVDNAYRAMLGRPVDQDALAMYTQRLRDGSITKLEVLGALRWSREGEQRGTRIHRLRLLWTLQRWKRKRLVGPVIEWAHAAIRLPRAARTESLNHAHSVREIQRIGELLNEVSSLASSRCTQLERQLAEVTTQLQLAESRSGVRDEAHDARLASLELIVQSEFGPEVLLATAAGVDPAEPATVRRPSMLVRMSLLEQRLEDDAAELRQLRGQLDMARTFAGEHEQRLEALRVTVEESAAARRDHHTRFDFDISAINARQSRDEDRLDALELGGRLQAELAPSSTSTTGALPGPEAQGTVKPASDMDVMYAALEDSFRGSRELVKERVRPYLQEVELVCGADPSSALVLDIGCGRGEWLELVRDAGYPGRGIDMNGMFVQTCRSMGLDVIHGDAFEVLRKMPPGSVSVITSMHLVEHLPFETMIALIDECHRALRPGGMLILETPNPENLSVGAFSFYMDPTHRNPIPPDLLLWLTRSRGFADVRIDRLTQARDVVFPELLDESQPGSQSINRIIEQFRAPLDYAVISRKTS
ncbi:methyltransferase domain-containing protein [Stenotrophomonas sp. PFBMAA-4]|uniref:class I SAM-dependent methyltransferase n=1 Tax=Stenotrophomonas sp. PFBMAA-4 TaxID=3043301 RepID=UPI0024B61864|nr:methyltransferase domain-containing protein [Stenotrophomonas sp. PFBMAA-4]MDI9273457.1 methyltransferase domain-containing protein [Stenotrophomonas sp. PFBMAA-4]